MTRVNAVGGPTLSPTKLAVPGGLTGPFDPDPAWNGIVLELLEAAIDSADGVTATAELVGQVGYDFDVPAASGYGPTGFTTPISAAVNLEEGFPSAAG